VLSSETLQLQLLTAGQAAAALVTTAVAQTAVTAKQKEQNDYQKDYQC
jgi:hypothetical protein